MLTSRLPKEGGNEALIWTESSMSVSGHKFEDDPVFGASFIRFICHETSVACKRKYGAEFCFCPYCGEEL